MLGVPWLYRSTVGKLQWQVVVFQNKRGDGKVYCRTGHEVEWWYKSTLAFTSALDGEGGLRQILVAFPLIKRNGTDL
jgi:hypothetical protein